MASLNKVILIGNLTRDPELKKTNSGESVCTFCIGVQRRFKDASGNYASDFINIVAWRKTADLVASYFTKGRAICIVGSIQVRKYVDQQGQNRYVTEVIADEVSFVDKKSDSEAPAPAASAPAIQTQPESKFEEISPDEDLPF